MCAPSRDRAEDNAPPALGAFVLRLSTMHVSPSRVQREQREGPPSSLSTMSHLTLPSLHALQVWFVRLGRARSAIDTSVSRRSRPAWTPRKPGMDFPA